MTYPTAPGYAPGAPQQEAQQPYAPPQFPQQGPPQPPAPPNYGQPPAPYGYPPAQGGYPGQAPQGYAQPPAPYGYPPQQPGYGQPPAGPVNLPSNPAGLDAYYQQPSTGWGPAWQLGLKVQDGTSYIGIVAQHITDGHFEYAENTDPTTGVKSVRTFRNGQPVVNMKVPMNVTPDAARFTDGRAQFYVGPGEKDLLNAAMSAAGAPEGPPELGAMIRATKTGTRGNMHNGSSAVKKVEYWRPGPEAQAFAAQAGIAYPDLNTPKPVSTVKAPVSDALPAAQAAPVVVPVPAVQTPTAAPQQFTPPAAPQAPPPVAPAPVAQAPAPPASAAAAGLSPEQQQLLATLTGQAPPPAA